MLSVPPLLKLLLLIYCSVKCTNEVRKLHFLLRQLWNENRYHREITLTSLQLIHQTIRFSGAHFFHLDFKVFASLITSFIGFATFSYQIEMERRAKKYINL